MFLVELFAHPAGRLVTLILLHFVWQGFAVQFLLIAVQQLGGIQRATVRYFLSLAALLLMAICPLTTLTWLWLRVSQRRFSVLMRQLKPRVWSANPGVAGFR
jgi:hypothetical protein